MSAQLLEKEENVNTAAAPREEFVIFSNFHLSEAFFEAPASFRATEAIAGQGRSS